MASHCGPSLQAIHAKVDDNATEAIMNICRACPNLIVLNILLEFPFDGDQVIMTAVKCCPLIEVLPTRSLQLTDASLKAMSSIHTLQQLCIFDDCTSAAIGLVLQSNPDITCISLGGFFIDDDTVRSISRCCGYLKSIDLDLLPARNYLALSDEVLAELFRCCPFVVWFELHQYVAMSNVTLSALFENCPHLDGLAIDSVIPSLDQDPIIHSYVPKLTKLWINNGGVTTSALQDIFTYCTNLREVHIHSCNQVNDVNITVLAQTCTSLDFLYLECCKNVSIAGLLEVATHCDSLTVLLLQGMPVNDEVLFQLSLNCLDLTKLSLLCCYGGPVTEAGMIAVVEACTDLTFTITGKMMESFNSTLDLPKLQQSHPHIKSNIAI